MCIYDSKAIVLIIHDVLELSEDEGLILYLHVGQGCPDPVLKDLSPEEVNQSWKIKGSAT